MKSDLLDLESYTKIAGGMIAKYCQGRFPQLIDDNDVVGDVIYAIALSDLNFVPEKGSPLTVHLRKWGHRKQMAVFVIKEYIEALYKDPLIKGTNIWLLDKFASKENVLEEVINNEECEKNVQYTKFLLNNCGLTKKQKLAIGQHYLEGRKFEEIGTSRQSAEQTTLTGINRLRTVVGLKDKV